MNTTLRANSDKSDKGFTLIEVLISLAILSIGILAVASLQVSSTLQSRNSLEITDASAIATSQMEELMLMPYKDVTLGDHSSAIIPAEKYSIPPDQFSIQWTVTESYLNPEATSTDAVKIPSKTIDLTVRRNSTGTNQRQVRFVFIKHNDLAL